MRIVLLLLACQGSESLPAYGIATNGDSQRGKQVISERHCGACHTIPDVAGANGVIGPPLTGFSRRSYIAGHVPNTPKNLIRWIQDPHGLDSQTAMPKLGLDEKQARDVAAYLYTLRQE